MYKPVYFLAVLVTILAVACAEESGEIAVSKTELPSYEDVVAQHPIRADDPEKWNLYGVSLGQELDDVRRYLSGDWSDTYSEHYGRHLLRAPDPDAQRHGMIVAAGRDAADSNIVNEVHLIVRYPNYSFGKPEHVAGLLEMVWGTAVRFRGKEHDRLWIDKNSGVQAHLRYDSEADPPIITISLGRFDGSFDSRVDRLSRAQWQDQSRHISAAFPSEPEKVEIANGELSAYAYQATKRFSDGEAFYSITVSTVSDDAIEISEPLYIEDANSSFVRSLGRQLDEVMTSWEYFDEGSQKLTYSFNYSLNGVPLVTRGFWIVSGDKIIRVAVSYTPTLQSESSREVLRFLGSFVLLK